MSLPLIFMPSRRTSAVVDGRGTPGQRDGCIGPASSGSWVFVCAARGFTSTLVFRARGGALRSNSAITRQATQSSSRTHTELREGYRLLNSMAYRSQAAACISSSPMTAQHTVDALSWGQRAFPSRSMLRYLCDGVSKQLLAQATTKSFALGRYQPASTGCRRW
jgi:hypothetical protein